MTHSDVEAYGLKCTFSGKTQRLYYRHQVLPGAARRFQGLRLPIVNMVRITHDGRFEHLIPEDVIKVLRVAKPKFALLNHFGMQVVKAGPDVIAQRIEAATGVPTIAAADGTKLQFRLRQGSQKAGDRQLRVTLFLLQVLLLVCHASRARKHEVLFRITQNHKGHDITVKSLSSQKLY